MSNLLKKPYRRTRGGFLPVTILKTHKQTMRHVWVLQSQVLGAGWARPSPRRQQIRKGFYVAPRAGAII